MRGDERRRWRVRSQDRFLLLTEGEAVIGRSPYCSLILDHETLSRVHATLRVEGDGLLIIDENSSNGTFVNGARIDGPTHVEPGDDIRLGKVLVWIEPDSARAALETGRISAVSALDLQELTLPGARKSGDVAHGDPEREGGKP